MLYVVLAIFLVVWIAQHVLNLERFAKLERHVAALQRALDQAQDRIERDGQGTEKVDPERPKEEPQVEDSAAQILGVEDAGPELVELTQASADAGRGPRETPPVQEPRPAEPAAAELNWADFKTVGAGEESLTSRWMVWIGGLALALGGVFMVNYSIEQGWLGPTARIVLGVLAGLLMVAAGEYVRRHESIESAPMLEANYVPGVLTGAGVSTLYASIYAAYALYGLISPIPTFALMGATSFGAIALALLHGQALGVLGLVGSLVVPLLVSTDEPQATSLFLYLIAVIGVSGAVTRFRKWWWLGWSAMSGGFLWFLAWFVVEPSAPAPIVLFVFALFLGSLAFWVTEESDAEFMPFGGGALSNDSLFAWANAFVAALSGLVLVRCDGYGLASLLILWLLCAAYIFGFWRRQSWYLTPLVMGAAGLAILATWRTPDLLPPISLTDPDIARLDPVKYPAFSKFVWVSVLFATLFSVSGFLAAMRRKNAGYWASLSASAPTLVLLIAYWRWTDFEARFWWALTGLAIAALLTLAGDRIRANRAAFGAYAVGVIAALCLALTMYLREAWLTVSLALLIPGIAVVYLRLNLLILREVALVLVVPVVARLIINPSLVDYGTGGLPVLNWILYGYGIPALAFWYAAKLFRSKEDDLLVYALEAGWIAFLTALITFQIRDLVSGSIGGSYDQLLESGLQTAAWLSIGYVLYERDAFRDRPVLQAISKLMRLLAAAHLILMAGFVHNPLFTGESIRGFLFFDLVFLAYGLPAIFAVLYVRAALRLGDASLAKTAGIAAVTLVFIYLSLEVRAMFHGPVLTKGSTNEAELYTYSAVWLLYGCALLALGYFKNNRQARIASLVILALATAKIFLIDMAGLTGIYRAISFLGLGAILVWIGQIYRRYIVPLINEPPEAEVPPTAP